MNDIKRSALDNISYNKKRKEAEKIVTNINKIYDKYKTEYNSSTKYFFIGNKSSQIKSKLKKLIANGIDEEEALKQILPEAYALVKVACEEVLGKKYYDVQLMSGILLNDGYISEMATGEGKTITAALPVYLNALLGKGAHVVTPNVYLAARDYEEMKPLYASLGLTCGLVEEEKHNEKVAAIRTRANKIYDEALKNKYYTADQKVILKRKALEKSIKVYEEKSIKDKQKQYNCDVTYGSAHAFAFDYLFDLLENDPTKLKTRLGNPNYVVVDEADLVLFDDAITSYNISGIETDSMFAITNAERKERQNYINKANYAMDCLFMNKRLLKEYVDPYEYDKATNTEEEIINNNTPAINYCSKTNEFSLTNVGNALLYRYFYYNDVNRIFNNNKDSILKLTYQGKKLFIPGHNYHPETNRFDIDPNTLALLIKSNKIKELTELYDKFILVDYQEAFTDISNVIYAWLFLEKNIDYKYTIPENPKNKFERQVSLLMNGRVASGRVYSNGLQQAVEAKEKLLIKKHKESTIIKETEMNDTLASIPVAAFFARYDKFAGMTGTSAKEAFRDLYQVETFEVPRNKKYNVTDHGDRLYKTTNDKYKGILKELLKSYKKGQPVLLATTSVEDSIKLYNYLTNNLKRMGINIDIPVLNANVDSLRKEANIISRAGKKYAVTIATDMAGRGTDIKLAGESATPQARDEIRKLGGLKIIASGHYKYARSDRQVKGRTGRQGDPGEVTFMNDLDDLSRIGMSPIAINYFEKMIKGEYLEENNNGLSPLQKAIRECQDKSESITKESICISQLVETPVAACRNQLHNMLELVKTENNYRQTVSDMLEVVLKDIYKASSDKISNNHQLDTNVKIGKDKLDTKIFNELSEEFLAMRIKEEVFSSFKTREELISFLKRTCEKRLSSKTIDKNMIDAYYHRIWLHFEDYIDTIKKQFSLAAMIPGTLSNNSKIDPSINEAFKYSYHSIYSQILRDILHPNRDKAKDHFGIFDLNIRTDASIEFINNEAQDSNKKYIKK